MSVFMLIIMQSSWNDLWEVGVGVCEESLESLGLRGITSCNGYRSSNFYPSQITGLALTS